MSSSVEVSRWLGSARSVSLIGVWAHCGEGARGGCGRQGRGVAVVLDSRQRRDDVCVAAVGVELGWRGAWCRPLCGAASRGAARRA
jgi:hypothetical protein